MKMGYEPNANHVQRKYGNVHVTLEFEFGSRTITFKSKLEARYANYLERLRELGGILGWWYEPVRLEFPDKTVSPKEYTPDFLVLTDGGEVELHECKGLIAQKDVHKLAQTRKHFPSFRKLVLVFAARSKSKPRIKAMASEYAEIRYANPLFKQLFGSTKAYVL